MQPDCDISHCGIFLLIVIFLCMGRMEKMSGRRQNKEEHQGSEEHRGELKTWVTHLGCGTDSGLC